MVAYDIYLKCFNVNCPIYYIHNANSTLHNIKTDELAGYCMQYGFSGGFRRH